MWTTATSQSYMDYALCRQKKNAGSIIADLSIQMYLSTKEKEYQYLVQHDINYTEITNLYQQIDVAMLQQWGSSCRVLGQHWKPRLAVGRHGLGVDSMAVEKL